MHCFASDRQGLEERCQIVGAELDLDAAIFRLRKKIETTTKRVAPIRTLHGVGYSLTGDVKF